MKKILDFIVIFLLVFFLMQYINGIKNNKNIKDPQETVSIKSIKQYYSVPVGLQIEINNNSTNNLKIDVCNDLKIKYIQTDNYIELPKSFCDKNIVEIQSGKVLYIDYSPVYEYFKDKGDYVVKANFINQNVTTNFKIKKRGTISKLFIYLFYAPAYNLIIFLIKLFSGSFGLSIIVITILLRLILLFPQHKMLVSQKKLQNLQPKIKKIQEDFKKQPQILGQKMMELYKKEKVNPMGSCGFLLIQMPILLVIYNVIKNINNVSNHYYLYPFLQNFNFNSINYHFLGINLFNKGGLQGIILAIIVGSLQFIQIYISNKNNVKIKKDSLVLEKKKGASDYSSMMPDPALMQKFMLYGMPIMVAIFTYNFQGGLGIYWGISTTFMIIQQLIVNKKT